MSRLSLRNRQKTHRINRPFLRTLSRTLLEDLLPPRPYELCIHLVSAREMARINQQFLNHTGPTDVITFDNSSINNTPAPKNTAPPLEGELYICPEVAQTQAREFQTTWQAELARYLVHGILHLNGYNDINPAGRRKMKRAENRLVTELAKRFRLSNLSLPSTVTL